ncbi:MAG: response regulator [Flavipsychrobacter sp.]
MNSAKVLVIDDEEQIGKLLEITLKANDFAVHYANTARQGINMAASYIPDVILLDIGLPDKSGHDVLKDLRQWYTKPIIILSVQNSEQDIVNALDNGANDYLVKPFRTGELLARIRAAIRKDSSKDDTPVAQFGGLSIDYNARTLNKDGALIKLTTTEYSLLVLFTKNVGCVLTHQYILKEVWGNAYSNETQYLRVFVAQLRKKIEDNPNQPVYIITESGVGYRFTGKE